MAENNETSSQEKRTAGFFIDLDKMEKALEEIAKNLSTEKEQGAGKPLMLNLSMHIFPQGEIIVQPAKAQENAQKTREPLVEISEQAENIVITAEMPGVEEKNIKTSVLENRAIEITALGEKKFYKQIAFNNEISRITQKKFKNGILELKIKK